MANILIKTEFYFFIVFLCFSQTSVYNEALPHGSAHILPAICPAQLLLCVTEEMKRGFYMKMKTDSKSNLVFFSFYLFMLPVCHLIHFCKWITLIYIDIYMCVTILVADTKGGK